MNNIKEIENKLKLVMNNYHDVVLGLDDLKDIINNLNDLKADTYNITANYLTKINSKDYDIKEISNNLSYASKLENKIKNELNKINEIYTSKKDIYDNNVNNKKDLNNKLELYNYEIKRLKSENNDYLKQIDNLNNPKMIEIYQSKIKQNEESIKKLEGMLPNVKEDIKYIDSAIDACLKGEEIPVREELKEDVKETINPKEELVGETINSDRDFKYDKNSITPVKVPYFRKKYTEPKLSKLDNKSRVVSVEEPSNIIRDNINRFKSSFNKETFESLLNQNNESMGSMRL